MAESDNQDDLDPVLPEILLHDLHRPILQILAGGPRRYVGLKSELPATVDPDLHIGEGQINAALRQLRQLGLVQKHGGSRDPWVLTPRGEESVGELEYLDRLIASDPDLLTHGGTATDTAVARRETANARRSVTASDYAVSAARFNPIVAHPARRYNYWLGGKDHFAADRRSADGIEHVYPGMKAGVRANRDLLHRGVTYLAVEEGIRQFLDIGTGLPTADNTHEVAQRLVPDARIVYVDNDPLVIMHAEALLTSSPEGKTRYLEADLRDPDKILQSDALTETLDLTQPVAVLLVGVLHFIPGQGVGRRLVRRLIDVLPRGSALFVTHVTNDFSPPDVIAAHARMQREGRSDFWMRDKNEVVDLFAGLEIVSPGVVPVTHWRPNPDTPDLDLRVVNAWAGVGLKR